MIVGNRQERLIGNALNLDVHGLRIVDGAPGPVRRENLGDGGGDQLLPLLDADLVGTHVGRGGDAKERDAVDRHRRGHIEAVLANRAGKLGRP